MDEKEKNKAVDETVLSICEWIQGELKESGSFPGSMMLPAMVNALANLLSASANRYEPVYQGLERQGIHFAEVAEKEVER